MEHPTSRHVGSRTKTSRGRGAQRGRGRGRGEPQFYRFAQGSHHLVFSEGGKGRLVPYKGPVEDNRLSDFHLFQLVSTSLLCDAKKLTRFETPADVQKLVEEALRLAMPWKAQFGYQIVYFGKEGGLSPEEESKWTLQDLEPKECQKLTDGPRRTTFTPLSFLSLEPVIQHLRSKLAITSEKVSYALRATGRRNKEGKDSCFDRIEDTREAVLDNQPFEVAASYVGQRTANLVFFPSRPSPSSDAESAVFRCQVVPPLDSAGYSCKLRVTTVDGRVNVDLLDSSGFIEYVRVEERHTFKIENNEAELQVLKTEEYGSKVPEKKNPVKVELKMDAQQSETNQQQRSWDSFVQTSAQLCSILQEFALAEKSPVAANLAINQHTYCNGESENVPCPNAFCTKRHRSTACLEDCGGSCRAEDCHFWHGRSETAKMLEKTCQRLHLDCANFSEDLKIGDVYGRLRAAFSLQLLSIRKAALNLPNSCEEAIIDGAHKAGLLPRLVEEYNAVAHSFQKHTTVDLPFYYRCCRRLKFPLPLLVKRDEILQACRERKRYLLLDAATGTGKSTQVPQYLAEFAAKQYRRDVSRGAAGKKQKLVICIEPRALAAELLAKHVASQYVDPELRYKKQVNYMAKDVLTLREQSHILYTTPDALLWCWRKQQIDFASDVSAVVFDEAHERTALGDLLLGLLRNEVERTNGAFQLVICSATLQMDVFRKYLPEACCISVQTRQHPVEVVYAGDYGALKADADYVRETVNATIAVVEDPLTLRAENGAVLRAGRHVLVFLPTATDAKNAQSLLKKYAGTKGGGISPGSQWERVRVCTISGHRSDSKEGDAFAISNDGERKVIFATAVAESAVTIDDVGYVIDSGLSQMTQYDAECRLTKLVVCPVTQSSAVQRAGRAGRTGPGICIRLYTQTDFCLLEKNNVPQVKTSPLHMVTLQLAQIEREVLSFNWIDKPNQATVKATLEELTLYEAVQIHSIEERSSNGSPVHSLLPFGSFVLGFEKLSVPTAKLLFEAQKKSNDSFLSLAALTAATIERFPFLLSYPEKEEVKFCARMRDYGRRFDVSLRGDVLCAVSFVVEALQRDGAQDVSTSEAAALQEYVNKHVLQEIQELHKWCYCISVGETVCSGEASATQAVPAVSMTVVNAHAKELQQLLARCFCLQVAVYHDVEGMGYETVSSAPFHCRLGSKSFLKQQHLLLEQRSEVGGDKTTVVEYDSLPLPKFCVFGSLASHAPGSPAYIFLCTPVELEWLPVSTQHEIATAQDAICAERRVSRPGRVPSAILSEWRPREVTKWLSRQCNTAACAVSVDYATHQLSLSCTPEAAEELSNKLSLAINHACRRHEQACYEVALSGFCRVTWRAGCEASEVLHDKNEYVTLQFSGVCDPAITCLDLDLSEMVEEWSLRWFGRRMLVTVRSGSGGASPASGQWTALVTFVNSKEARDFYARHETAVEADCGKVLVEPYCEQEPLAPSVEATVPLCRIGLRLYTNHFDPESDNMDSRTIKGFPAKLVDDFWHEVSAALPSGVTVESHHADQAQGLLHMQFVAANAKVAEDALSVLHHIRGPSMHFCPLFLDDACSVVFPLPPLVNKLLQDVLQDALARRMEANEDDLHCEPLHAQGKRSLLLRCTNAAVLCRAEAYLRELTTVHEVPLPGRTHVEQMNWARAVAAQRGAVVYKVNAQLPSTEDCVVECQLQLREADGKLCFIGSNEAFLKLQRALEEMEPLNAVSCTTLTLPPRGAAAVRCSRWVSFLEARCRANGEPAQVVRDRDTIVFLGPAAVVEEARCDSQVAQLWRAIDGEVNAHYDSQQAGDEAQDVTAGDECALCLCELQPDHVQLLCGHRCCTECLSGAFNAEAGAPPALPLTCASCRARIAADEIRMFAPARGLRRLGEVVRSRFLDGPRAKHGEMKECPNRSCRGIPVVVTDAHRRCSGCNLAYCAVCWRNEKLLPWHDGEHYTPTEVLAESLVEELPLLPRCPQCQLPFYDFDGCFALRCRHGHSFCGFCMQECEHDADEHVRHCPRNPKKNELYASSNVFYRCRSEDLAQRMKDVVLQHPAGPLHLAEAVCNQVKERMCTEWPQGPVNAAEEVLARHNWNSRSSTTSHRTATTSQPTIVLKQTSHQQSTRAAETDEPIDRAQHLLSELENYPLSHSAIESDSGLTPQNFQNEVQVLRREYDIDLCASAHEAIAASKTVEDAAVFLYCFSDVDRKIEGLLRSQGTNCLLRQAQYSFMHFLLRGLQRARTTKRADAERKARLTSTQAAAYTPGLVVVWEAPTLCRAAPKGGGSIVETDGLVTLRITCATYTRVSCSRESDGLFFILPAGARLSVTKVEKHVIYLQQMSDSLFNRNLTI